MSLAAEHPGRRYYFDWQRTASGQAEEPPNSPFNARRDALARARRRPRAYQRGRARAGLRAPRGAARAARAGIEAIGLAAIGPDNDGANVPTVVRLLLDLEGAAVPKLMRDRYGVTAAGGQGQPKGQIVRIADAATTAPSTSSSRSPRSSPPSRCGCRGRARGRREPRSGCSPRPAAPQLVAYRTDRERAAQGPGEGAIADAGVELLRERFQVELGLEWTAAKLQKRIGEFDAILVRSATDLDGLIQRAERLKVIGRAGTGVDNVDVEAATKRGSSSPTPPRKTRSPLAAEHTMALDARPLPEHSPGARVARGGRMGACPVCGHRALRQDARHSRLRSDRPAGRRARSRLRHAGGRLRQVRHRRALPRARGRRGVEPEELYAALDFITLHLPQTAETVNFIDAEAIARMRDGVRIVNRARGELDDLYALVEGLESGRVAGAALDVFLNSLRRPPDPRARGCRRHPSISALRPPRPRTGPGLVTAQQAMLLTGSVTTTAVNIAAARPEVMERLAPFGSARSSAPSTSARWWCSYWVEVEFLGRPPTKDTGILGLAALAGILRGATEEAVNLVNAPHLAEERGTRAARHSRRDLTRLHRADRGPGR